MRRRNCRRLRLRNWARLRTGLPGLCLNLILAFGAPICHSFDRIDLMYPKPVSLFVGLATAFLGELSAGAQGTFENLDFEMATPISAGSPYNPEAVTVASAVP